MAKRERNKSQRRRRSRVESTVQLDEEYVEATKNAEAEASEPEARPIPESTEKEPEEPDRVEKIEPEEGSKTFGPNDAGWVAVEIAEHNQQAAVTALHFGDKKVKAQLFVDALRDQFKLVHGLKKQALKELISQARKEDVVRGNFVVAEATAATPGKDASVKLEFQEGLGEDTKLSFSELNQALQATELEAALELDVLSLLVYPGQKLASLTPPTEGKPAVDVCGNQTPQAGADAKLSGGENVKMEGGTCVSEIYGYVCWLKDEISVRPPIWINPDWDEAYLLHLPQAAAEKVPQKDWLLQAIKMAGVTTGIKDTAIERLSKETFGATEKQSLLVAKGKAPIAGKDSYVKYAFDPEKRAGKVLEDGTIDYRERNQNLGVAKDQELGTVIPAEQGTPGVNLKGEQLPAKDGEEKSFSAGQNVRLQGDKFVAEIDGAAAVAGDALEVQPVMSISGDVGYDTGNIDLPMNVEISGSVQSGFSVKAAGSVVVGGTVENGASVTATGDVVVAKGIFGEDSTVFAKQNVETKFIQNSTVQALGNVNVGAYIINGIVKADGEVVVQEGGGQGAGTIVGGEVTATVGIHAKMIGSADTDRTIAEIGPTFEQAAELKRLESTLDECKAEIPALMRTVGLTRPDVTALKEHLDQVPRRRMDEVADDAKKLAEFFRQQKTAQTELEKLESGISDIVSKGRITVTGTVFTDVQIGFGEESSLVDADVVGAEFHVAGGDIKWRPLKKETDPT